VGDGRVLLTTAFVRICCTVQLSSGQARPAQSSLIQGAIVALHRLPDKLCNTTDYREAEQTRFWGLFGASRAIAVAFEGCGRIQHGALDIVSH
jgi:hypothetical protein